jgi:rod shape-determining protein MreC
VKHIPNIILGFAVLTAVVAVNAFIFRGRLTGWATDISGHILAPGAARLDSARGLVGTLTRRVDLAAENARLRDEVERLTVQAAGADDLRRELEFARSAAGLVAASGRPAIDASVFSYPRAGGLREAILNKGSRDGVATGDVVVSAPGALVGVVSDVFDEHAVVVTLGDPSVEAAGRIVGTAVSGLVRSSADDLVLDLVSRDEAVSEGQVVVTSGNDGFPSALIIGTVRSVDTNQTTLFTVIRLTPAFELPPIGHVLVIRP